MSQLEDSRISENSLRREITRKNNQISALQQQLEESKNNLLHSFRKLESLSEQYEKTIDQQTRISVRFTVTYPSRLPLAIKNFNILNSSEPIKGDSIVVTIYLGKHMYL